MALLSQLESYQSKWLKGEDLNGRQIQVRISKCTIEEMNNRDGSKEMKGVLSFEGQNKRLPLNKTNQKIMEMNYGDIENFAGKTVILAPNVTAVGIGIAIQIPAITPAYPPMDENPLRQEPPVDFGQENAF